jgi:NADH:ubiquinone oxidoreductase subunit 2 (subunit N)
MAILVLLLASTSSINRDSLYLIDYIKFNRTVLFIFILSGYLAFNALDIEAFGSGIGIYGGVFKVTVLSQILDIFLFVTGGIVTILTCFVPYNFKKYDNSELSYFLMEDKKENEKIVKKSDTELEYTFFKSGFKDYYYKKLLNYYPYNYYRDKSKIEIGFLKLIKYITKNLPDLKIRTPYLVENKLDYNRLEVKEYSLLLLYTVLGGSLLISAQNLISLYLSLELQSFTLYILSASQIKSFKGTSGGLKYFLLGGLSSGFILLGCSLLYAYTGTLNLEHIFIIYSDNISNWILDPCLLILFSGLLFKVSAAPFHNWAPDVYSDVPTYSTTWLIIIAKISVLILMLLLIHNIYVGLNINNLSVLEQGYSISQNKELGISNNINSLFIRENIPFSFWNPSYNSLGLWTNILTLSAIFSLIVGTVLGLSQSRIKRLFAYSTITHVGFLLLALSLNSITGTDAFIFYLIQYTITNLNLFFILIAWGYLYSKYYLDTNFILIRYLNINPYSWKDIYVEPTLYDFFDSIRDNTKIWNSNEEIFHPTINNTRINTLNNYLLMEHNTNFYDFSDEDREWLYTPVPYITNFKGMHKTDPFLAFCLAVTIFSLTGIPPLIGFFAKQQVLLASMQSDYYLVSIVAIFTSVIGAAYYLRIIKFIYFYDDIFMPYYLTQNLNKMNSTYDPKSDFLLISDLDHKNSKSSLSMLPSNSLSFVIAILTNISLFYILKPYLLINGINIITIPLFQY